MSTLFSATVLLPFAVAQLEQLCRSAHLYLALRQDEVSAGGACAAALVVGTQWFHLQVVKQFLYLALENSRKDVRPVLGLLTWKEVVEDINGEGCRAIQ